MRLGRITQRDFASDHGIQGAAFQDRNDRHVRAADLVPWKTPQRQAEDLDVCIDEGVLAAQGYFLGRPARKPAPPSEEFRAWLAARGGPAAAADSDSASPAAAGAAAASGAGEVEL